MKKRLLSALLALALVFVLLPTTALAGVTTESDYDISIDGKRYKFDSDGSGGYTTAYYQENNSKTPTSNCEDVWQTNPYLEITRVDNIITITVKIGSKGSGKSVTIGASTQENYECIAVNGTVDLIITGDKGTSLTLNKTHSGAALSATKGSITITDGVKVSASFRNKADGNYVFYAIWAKNLTVSGANTEVTASGNCEDAIHVSGTVTVSKGAKLTATNDHNDKYKPYPITKSSAIKSDVLTIADENSCVIAQAIDSSYGKPLRIQNYNIAGATIKAGSSNYNSTETTIDKIDGNTYVKISIPALQRTSDVLIAKENAVVGQWTNIPAAATGTGSYYYDADKKELTLKDVNITHSDGAIVQFMAGAPYIIKLEGTNSIKDVSSFIRVPENENAYESLDGISVTISGSGSLEVTARGNAITMLKGDLVFNNTGAITLETNTLNGKAINVSGNISIGDDFNKNLRITADNGDMTFDPTNQYTDYNDLKNYKSITIASKPSETYYNGTAMKYGETRTAGSGTISCDENGAITLNGATEGTLVFNAKFTPNSITLIGDSTLSAVETKYQNLTISGSGSGSLTVGSIRVTNNDNISADLTINGATVTVGTAELTTRAIDIKGDLTVTNGSLTATSNSNNVPTVQVGGNASFTGSTVTITNNSTTQGEQYKDSNAASSALHVNGAVTISGGTVMAEAKAGGNAIRAVGNITVSNDATVTAKNNSQYFNAITAGSATGGEVDILHNLIVSGENTRITATNTHDNNLTYGGAINAYIKNANEGHYLQVGTDTKAIAPNVKTTVRNNSLTITRGDEVARTPSPVDIDGHTLLNDTYYTINGSTVAEGTESNYNAFYNSTTKTLKLNNAKISTTTNNAAIKISEDLTITVTGTNELKGNYNHCIESYNNFTINGTGTLNMTNTSSSSSAASVIYCGPYKRLTIAAEVIIKNEAQPDKLIYTVEKDAYSFAEGYNVYASTDVSGSPLETYDAAKSSTYKYLRITTHILETGGGSTHQHVWDEAWHDTGDYHHAHQCTICKAYDTATQESHNVTGHKDNHDGSHLNICGSCGYSAKVSHSYTWTPNANDNEKHIGTCVCGNVVEKNHNFVGDVCSDCGYDKSAGTTCEHVWTTEWTIDTVDNEYHWHKCIKCNAITDKKPHAYTIVTDSGTNHIRECECKVFYVEDHISSDWIIDTPATATTAGSMHKECTVCKHKMQTEVIPATGEIEPPTPDNPGTIVIIRPAEEEKPAQQPNPSTGANDLVGLAVAAAVAAALGSAALLRKHD